MCNTEFIQIEAGLLKVNAGGQHSKCLKHVKCRRGSYKFLVNNHYGKQPQDKYGIWSCMHITSACSHQSCMCGKFHFCICNDNVIQISYCSYIA